MGTVEYWFRCPKCNTLGAIDEEQADGKVSIVCPVPTCDFHETGEVESKVNTMNLVSTIEKGEDSPVPFAPTMKGW